jgi:hypothetical protein
MGWFCRLDDFWLDSRKLADQRFNGPSRTVPGGDTRFETSGAMRMASAWPGRRRRSSATDDCQ